MPSLPTKLVIDAVQRASMRAAADEHIRMRGGVTSLATIAATAPLFGFFGTVIGIVHSFQGCDGEKSTCLAAVEWLLSDALMPTALGLFVAILAYSCYRDLTNRLAIMDIEKKTASLNLANSLARLPYLS
jgi:biopolymer transport protein ExbB/TolQ